MKKPLHKPCIINAAFGVLAVHEAAFCLAPPSPNMQSYFGIVQEKAVGHSEDKMVELCIAKSSSTSNFSSSSLCDNDDNLAKCYFPNHPFISFCLYTSCNQP